MKSNRIWMVVLALAILFCAIGAPLAAGEEAGGAGHFSWNFEEKVKPERMETYMQARIADARLSAEKKFPLPFLTFVNDFEVTTCGIFTRFAQMDDYHQMMAAWNEKTEGKAEQLNQQMSECVDRIDTSISAFRPDLSYTPQDPASMPDFTKPFYQKAILYHIKPGKDREAESVARRLKELNESKQSPMGYWMYQDICAPQLPTLIAIVQTKDKASFVALDEKMKAEPDQEIEKVFRENVGILAGIETMEGTFVPEASYVPEGAFGGGS